MCVVKWLPIFWIKCSIASEAQSCHLKHSIFIFFYLYTGSQGHLVPRSQAASDVLENPDPVLHEPKKPGIPSKSVAVCHAIAQDDRAKRQYDQAHVVSVTDSKPNTQGY